MYFLIYSSYARIEFNQADLKVLLIQSREKNKQSGVSGMLLFLNGKFIQFLEGEEKEIKSLYAKISQDKRHTSVVLLKEGTTDQRLFTNWSMAFSSVTPEELANEEGLEKINSPFALQVFTKLSSNFQEVV
ncbi:MAG: BLUF domain-containing protein [Sphingobacteriaceae bacterium]|nr:MAG: BLUF domain-containing protein [Sphingobacteriaceae bacterium]